MLRHRKVALSVGWHAIYLVNLFYSWLILGLLVCSSLSFAQDKLVDPSSYGFRIPPGPISDGHRECVLTNAADGRPVVARVHVNVGEYRIVRLPDGELVARSQADSPTTSRPFKPSTKDDLVIKLKSSGFANFRFKQTQHYLYAYNTSEAFATATSRILETMYPGVKGFAQGQNIDVHDPETPLLVIMFRTREDFQRFERMPEGIIAYYNTLTNYVVMYEESGLSELKPELAMQQAISTIAHEGTHQILHNIGVQQRLSLWPMWLSEGLAEYLAPTSTDKRLRWKGPGQINDFRMFELEQYLKSRAIDTASGEMLEKTITAAKLTSTGYATSWSLTYFLAKHRRSEFNKYVAELSRLRPFEGNREIVAPGIIPANKQLFEKYFGAEYADLEKRLMQTLRKQPYTDPFHDWPHFVAVVSVAEGRRVRNQVNLFHSPRMADTWVREVVEKSAAKSAADVKTLVRPFPNRASAEVFARQQASK